MGMSGQDQRASGQLCERVPMPRRNRQATLRIETERGCALKHASPTSSPERARKTHFFPLSPTSSHFRTKGIPGQAEPRANPFCAQALRGDSRDSGNPLINQRRYRRLRKLKLNSQGVGERQRRSISGQDRAMSKNVILAIRHATAPQRNGEKWGEKGKTEEKKGSSPISRVLSSGPIRKPARRAIIPLDDVLPRRSSSLPGDSASSVDVPLFGLAPDGVYRAVTVTSAAVGSYPTVSPLPDLRRAIGGLLSVALSVAFTRRLWRPAVSRHPALWGPDFPRCANTPRLPGELPGAQYSRSGHGARRNHSDSRKSAALATTSSRTQSSRA